MSFNNALTAVLVICAVVTTGVVVHRQIVAPASTLSSPARKPVFVENWRAHASVGVRLGPSDAPVQVIEFSDFECPFCASFHQTLKTARERYPSQLSLSYVHYPIPGHRFAEPAARAAECAHEQGRFAAMHDNLFEQQRLLGLKSWRDYASEAGVPNLDSFDLCMRSPAPLDRIAKGRALGSELDIQGTPTVLVNGWRLAAPPTQEELDGMINAILAGGSPVSAITEAEKS